MSGFHHVEIWVPNYPASRPRWAWLLEALGWSDFQDWPNGHSWRAADGSYLVIEESSDLSARVHHRTLPGMNHLAVTAASRGVLDRLAANAPDHGWTVLFPDRHPHAGGANQYAAYLSDDDGYEVEIVATLAPDNPATSASDNADRPI